VTAPDGSRWIVGRHWLARRPRYRGFRFGVDPYQPSYEPPAVRNTDKTPIRKPRAGRAAPPAPNPYRDNPESAARERRTRRRVYGGGDWIWWGGGRTGGSRSSAGRSTGGGLGSVFSSGGGSRGSRGGGSRSRSSGGGGRKGGGGAGGGLAGLLALLVKVLKWLLIAAIVIAVALFVVFVGLPALLFLVEHLVFWIVVGATALYNGLSGRPWIIKATREGYETANHAYRVRGWRRSTEAVGAIAEAIRHGETPALETGEEVELIEH
jgi:hypothetical protein